MVESMSEWLERNPRAREFGGLALLLFAVFSSFYLGLSLRTVHSYTCFSYIGIDNTKGWIYPGKFVPDCRAEVPGLNLSCSPGTQLYTYEYGIYAGDNLPNLTNGAGNK